MQTAGLPAYAELHAVSNFSFQRGASHPEELVERACALGYTALALTDECSVAGMVRAHGKARALGMQLLPGAEFLFGDFRLVVLARNLDGWGHLCECITAARAEAPKGHYRLDRSSPALAHVQECEILFAPCRGTAEAPDFQALLDALAWARTLWSGHLWLAAELWLGLDDDLWLQQLQRLSERAAVPLVASGDVHMHVRSRKPLQDVITAVGLGRPVAQCGLALQPNAERHLRHRLRLAQAYPPELLARTVEVAQRCHFTLDAIRYNYPRESVPPGMTPAQALRQRSFAGAALRYPHGVPERVRQQLLDELQLIAECQYEMFFLTVDDIVGFARSQRILCQGRGSAANSVVCYCLGITAVDPVHSSLLLQRFISRERRSEPPDIDVDFEHTRREEVIQYIYRKYGRERAALAAVVITYRTRSALRDVGSALGLPAQVVDACAKNQVWFDDALAPERWHAEVQRAAVGVSVSRRQAQLWLDLTQELRGFPRHLSQHVGGFVLTQDKLTRLVPVENAAMKERSVIQWEKDDLEAMGLMKVDVLALGMLTAIRRCLDLRNALRVPQGHPAWELHHIPAEDSATYDMVCRADTVGVFQIESRAQMSMLPRLQPRVFYDLVVQVAIVRPGPIQGGMVHPYLQARERRRQNLPIRYEKPELEEALGRTLGVPIFQEQVMQISMLAAGFSPGQADALRRSMAAWKRKGGVERFHAPLVEGMKARGYSAEFAQSIFRQIMGFGEYGFPESHAYSFALLAYASSWLKCHEPACFLVALLNSQPMGFYSPSQLVQDARRHGVEVRPADVVFSEWNSSLEAPAVVGRVGASPEVDPHPGASSPCVRLGLDRVGRLSEAGARRTVAARAQAPFTSTQDLALRAQLDSADLRALAAADALQSLSGHRRQQVWDAAALLRAPALLREAPIHEAALQLPAAPEGEEILWDYASTGLSLRRHPMALLRARLEGRQWLSARQLHELPDGQRAAACGIVTLRQQPQTAHGTIFVTLEDETGTVNVIVWKRVRQAQREALLHARLLAVHGVWQCSPGAGEGGGGAGHLVARRLTDMTPLLGRLGRLGNPSRDFH